MAVKHINMYVALNYDYTLTTICAFCEFLFEIED